MYKPNRDQKNQQTGDFRPRGPRAYREEIEREAGKEDYIICPDCNSVYEGKGWHHHSDYDIERLKKEENVQDKQCPACKMIEDKYFQGEIVIENPPTDQKEQIKNTAQNYGEKAFKRDPLDRVISIGEKKVQRPTAQEKRGKESRDEVKGRTDIRILTTENQLAVRIAKKINESLGNKAELNIKHSHRDKVSRVRMKFPNPED